MDVASHNRKAWNRRVAEGNRWTVPVSPEAVAAARGGEFSVVLTPTKPVPRGWFGELEGSDTLCLACGGGQQGPILAAAGARVTVLDNAPAQLEQDRRVAEREGLDLALELGDMADLSRFPDRSFDLVFHPVANCFVPEVRPVWREAARVLRPGGRLLAGFGNPVLYLFDEADDAGGGPLVVKHRLPYSDLTHLDPAALERRIHSGEPLEFGHSLEDQIGGQLDAGFVLAGLYEDGFPGSTLAEYAPPFLATLALRLPVALPR